MANNNRNGVDVSANYTPTLKTKNPVKQPKDDWWDELCAKYNTKNHWRKEEKKKSDKENKSEKESK